MGGNLVPCTRLGPHFDLMTLHFISIPPNHPVGIVDRTQKLRKARGFIYRPSTMKSWTEQHQVILREEPYSYDAVLRWHGVSKGRGPSLPRSRVRCEHG